MTLLILLGGGGPQVAPSPVNTVSATITHKDGATIVQTADGSIIVKTPDDDKEIVIGGTITS